MSSKRRQEKRLRHLNADEQLCYYHIALSTSTAARIISSPFCLESETEKTF